MKGNPWTDEEYAQLRASYLTMSNAEIASMLGRTEKAISGAMHVLCLKRPCKRADWKKHHDSVGPHIGIIRHVSKPWPVDYKPSTIQVESIAAIAEAKRRVHGTYRRPV